MKKHEEHEERQRQEDRHEHVSSDEADRADERTGQRQLPLRGHGVEISPPHLQRMPLPWQFFMIFVPFMSFLFGLEEPSHQTRPRMRPPRPAPAPCTIRNCAEPESILTK